MPKRKKEYCFWNFHPFGVKWSYKESSKHVILYLNCTQARSGYHLFGGEYCFFCLKNSRKCSIFFQRCFFSSVHVWIRESAHERIRTNLEKSIFRIIRALSHLLTSFKTPHHLLHTHPNWELGVPVSKLVHLARFWLNFNLEHRDLLYCFSNPTLTLIWMTLVS